MKNFEVLNSGDVWDFAKNELGLELKDWLISERQDNLLKETFEVRREFVNGDNMLQSAWYNNKCIAVCSIYNGKRTYLRADEYEQAIGKYLDAGFIR